MELTDVIPGRRAIRDYTDDPVSKGAVETLLRAAVQAPSAINSQPWTFVVIQDKSLLKTYSDRAKSLCAELFATDTSHSDLMGMLTDPSYNIFYNSGTLIVICAKPIGQHPGTGTVAWLRRT